MDLREQIGQRLVTGFPGTELTEDFRRMVREYKISNVILFRENITDCAQLKQLCGEIQALVRRETGHGAFITADQEGGLVTRCPGDAVNGAGRYGHRRHGRARKMLPRRAFDGAGAARAGCQFRPCPQCGRQFQPGKSGHRCAKLRRHARRRSPVTPTG